AIADAAERWRDGDFPARVRTLQALAQRTTYTVPIVEYALDRLFGAIDRETLCATIAGELGSLAALDGFVTRAGRPDVFFCGLPRAAIVSSDTTIGVAIPALIFALCAGSSVVVKDRDDRLTAAFVETLAEEWPELGARVVASVWDGRDDAASRAHLGEADVVVAYGRTATLGAIRANLRADARFVAFGHRTSVGYVTRAALANDGCAREVARGAARDALLYDGDGCLSIHALFVERGATLTPESFARLVAVACDEAAIEFPPGSAELDAPVAVYRRTAFFRASQGAGATFADPFSAHVVVLDPPRDEPPPLLRRTLALYAVDGPHDALEFVRRHAVPLEAVGIGGAWRPDVEAFAIEAGASRLATLGDLQTPPLGGEHGGAGRILPFVRAIYRG
ncbi:MAG: hypothetical protein M3R53_03940, partial [Candidatus Eremiobacteraeota bacterium]|nr:hypothetical protein [Candidatus Eremiobacteraeota bacterium]